MTQLFSEQEFQAMVDLLEDDAKVNIPQWKHLYYPYFTEAETQEMMMEGLMTSERSIRKTPTIDPNQFKTRIKDLETKLKNTEDPDEISNIQHMMKSYGWNPEMEFNETTQELAKKRILDHYANELDGFKFLDFSYEIADIQKSNPSIMTESANYAQNVTPVHIITGPRQYMVCVGLIESADIEKMKERGLTEGSVYEIAIPCSKEKLTNLEMAITDSLMYFCVEFVTPSIVTTARLIKEIYDFCEIEVSFPTVVNKCYEGALIQEAVNAINAFSVSYNHRQNRLYTEVMEALENDNHSAAY